MSRAKIFSSFTLLFMLFNISANAQQYITVATSTYTAEQLVRDVFIGSQNAGCITVSNVSTTGWQNAGGSESSHAYFEKGSLPFDINKGIILSTGAVRNAPGPNNVLLDDQDDQWPGDPDLAAALQESVYNYLNATSIEFDFVANSTSGISFEYLFLSEEYRRTNCTYSDGFAFLIKKAGTADPYTNIALVPGTQDPVTSLSINTAPNCPRNTGCFGSFNGINSPTAFDGQTKVLTAKTDIIAGVKYHIKLVIADHLAGSDRTGRYDSAVFLKAGSFVGKKDLGPDLLIATNNPVCEGSSKILDATTAGATSYRWFKDGVAIPGATNARLTVPGVVSSNGNYEVEVNVGGCILTGSVQIEIQEKPALNLGTYSLCDDNLSGSVPVDFSKLDPQIISNFNSAYQLKYYLKKSDSQAGTPGTELQNGWLLTADTTIYIRIESALGCNPEFGEITLKIGNKTPLVTSAFSDDLCDNDLDGNITVNLKNYQNEFMASPQVIVTFYNSPEDARNKVNPIAENQIITNSKVLGIRVESSSACPNVATLTLNFKSPKKSDNLKDKVICSNATTSLDAGTGFDSYLWSTGDTTSQINNVPVGEYWVDLGSNGCIYRQTVKVTASTLPQITNIDVAGNTATVLASGGIQPYEYSLDNITFQNSNVFTNIPRGLHKIYVRDANKCQTVEKDFLVINLVNVITPNGDGLNDVLDYSDLRIKQDVSIKIFDRYGNLVFTSKDNQFIWDGKLSGRALPTANYWYVLNWTEPDTQLPVSYKGWILLKNRD
ncbi:MAG: gliding motility-associated C-terminal domain-containing protein [Flavobacteriia bacterium]|nr:gliding motility-associated C-terminal domain-containing protein [Flavobacteriia bacterium]MBH2024077.1 gliding motility-associated C-terminal domain-containing protein [Flavobacteriales bacterium]